MKPALTPHQFVDTWANVRLKESAAYVTHFDDLCALIGHPKPAHMDKTGETFTYQKGACHRHATSRRGKRLSLYAHLDL